MPAREGVSKDNLGSRPPSQRRGIVYHRKNPRLPARYCRGSEKQGGAAAVSATSGRDKVLLVIVQRADSWPLRLLA